MRTHRDQMKTERDGTVHRKIIGWGGQNDLFSSKDRLFGPSKRLMYLKVIFFQMYHVIRNMPASCKPWGCV